MSNIDDRVVQLKFDNSAFESAVAVTLTTLDKLKKSLDFSTSKKGMDDLQASAGKFNLGNIGATIEGASGKFLALATIGITALSRIADKAITVGTQLVKSLTIDPVIGGLHEYETNLNAIQTVLANTQTAGTTLKDVNAALNELNIYSDKTIYNFGEMARNIGTFTAAGVDLKTSVDAIKGIANLAALSGSNSQQASTAMYQLSQALSAGKVSLQDWNSVVNAGMGGTVFQRALALTAEKMGKLKEGSVKLSGAMKNVTVNGESFRNSISGPGPSWLTSDVLTSTLKQFTGDLTDAELAAQGFSAAEIKAIQAQAKTAMNAATQVKTLSQVFDVAKETAQSGWSQTFSIIFGDFGEAKSTFTALSNNINDVINKMSAARNALLTGWKALGGRDVAIQAIKNAFAALSSVLKPIKEAFRQIFPAATAKDLYDMTVRIRDFFATLKLGPEQMALLKRTFAGVFAVLDIGKQIIMGVLSVFKKLFSAAGESSGGILEFTARIGDFLVNLDNAIRKGGALAGFFDKLGTVIAFPIKLLGQFASFLVSIFDGKNEAINATGDALGRIGDRLSPFGSLLSTMNAGWQKFLGFLSSLSPFLANMVQSIGNAFSQIGPAISNSVANGDYSAMLDTINTVIFGGIALLIRKFLKSGLKVDVGGGFLSKIGGAFDALTGSLKAMQQQLKAKALLEIAAAVALLAASVVALSLIDSAKLASALAGMSVMFAELMTAMAVLGKIAGGAGFIKIPLIAASLIMLSTAILILSAALTVIQTMNWEELARGLTGLGTLLVVVAGAMRLMPNPVALVAQSGALILLGVALNLIAAAVKSFSDLNWADLGKGLAGVAGSLLVIAGAMQLMPTGMVLQAGALILIGTALTILAKAVESFGNMKWGVIGKGLVGLGGALLVIAGAMWLMPPSMIAQAAALILVGTAITIIGKALKQMGGMSWEEIGKGLVTLGGALLVLAGGLYLMSGTLAGSAALLVAAGALAILTPVLKVLGGMGWGEIVKGLVALAGVFAVVGIAALLLTPAIVPMLGLAAAIAILGVGLALIGAGVLAFATAITMLVAVGSMGTAALVAILQTVIGIIPTVMKALEVALVAFAGAIIAAAPALITAIVVVLTGLLDAIIRLTPKVVQTLGVMLDALIAMAVKYIPKLVTAGMQIITGILDGIAKNIPKMATAATNVILAFLKALGEKIPQLADGALKMVIAIINGLSKAIDDNAEALGKAGGKLAKSVITGMVKGIGAGVGEVVGAAKDLAGNMISGIKGFLHIGSPSKDFITIGQQITAGLVVGIVSGQAAVTKSITDIAAKIKSAMDASTKNIAALKANLAKLEKKPRTKANKAEISKTKAALAEAEAAHKKLVAANKSITAEMKAQEARLKTLGAQYDTVTAKLKDANQALTDAIKQRDDFAKGITDKFSVLPTIDAETSLDTYFDSIRKATAANLKFKATLEELRKIGLDDTSYKKFLEQGVAAQPFLDQLLDSGASTVAELNKIDTTLIESATDLGKSAGEALYGAGVQAAQGIVDGLTANLATITAEMKKIGAAMAAELKKELGIKSPSKVFASIGKDSTQGLADGLERYSNVVDLSARRVGKVAVDSLRNSMSGISDVISGDIDLTPVIAPVLDLDQFRKDASGITDILAPKSIVPTTSSLSATSISDAAAAQKQDQAAQDLAATGTTLEFNQYNTSPKALSSAEIYRQTKNQLSIVKGALPN